MGCPVIHSPAAAETASAAAAAQTSGGESAAAAAGSASTSGCPVHARGSPAGERLNPDNAMPAVANQLPAAGQRLPLSKERVESTIPQAGAEGGHWVYPSAQMFYNAMRRKGFEPQEEDMRTVVAIHNTVNERTWREITPRSPREYPEIARDYRNALGVGARSCSGSATTPSASTTCSWCNVLRNHIIILVQCPQKSHHHTNERIRNTIKSHHHTNERILMRGFATPLLVAILLLVRSAACPTSRPPHIYPYLPISPHIPPHLPRCGSAACPTSRLQRRACLPPSATSPRSTGMTGSSRGAARRSEGDRGGIGGDMGRLAVRQGGPTGPLHSECRASSCRLDVESRGLAWPATSSTTQRVN